jgi:hypothetical protein
MTPLGSAASVSPLQQHAVVVVTDLYWASGQMDTLGPPHFYLNHEGLTYYTLSDATLVPWDFTGLPVSKAGRLYVRRAELQMLFFVAAETNAEYHEPSRRGNLLIHLPLIVIRGAVPFLSEAKANNFLDFLKGELVPVMGASLHYLGEASRKLPTQLPLIYVQRQRILSYTEL